MSMQVVLPDEALPAMLKLNSDVRIMDDDEFYEFCMSNPDLRLERTEQGEIIIVPPAGYESDYQSNDIARQLSNWAKKDGRGKVSGSSAEFILPTGAALSPDTAWVSNGRLATLLEGATSQILADLPGVCGRSDVPQRSSQGRSAEDAGLDSRWRQPRLAD